MRLVIARCSVDYVGRLTAHLPMAPRLLMVKADGSVLVHSDGGSYKPLNWMSPPCKLAKASSSTGPGNGRSPTRPASSWSSCRSRCCTIPRTSSAWIRGWSRTGRGAPADPAGRAHRPARPGLSAGAPGVPDRDRAGRHHGPGCGRAGGCGRDQAARRDRRGRAADPVPRTAQPRSAAGPGPGRVRRPGIKPQARTLAPTAASTVWCWTTTNCAASTPPAIASSRSPLISE